jgi:zinc transport system substrate-binding protein
MFPQVKALSRIFLTAVGGVLLLGLVVGGALGDLGRMNVELRRSAGFGEGSVDWKSAIQSRQVGRNLRYDGPADTPARNSRFKIVTTILPLYCFTVGVAGDLAQVDNLLPENASGHDYQLSAQDARKLSNANVVIATGMGLEDSLLGRRLKTPAVKAGAGVEPIRGHIHEDHRHGDDVNPHFWLDPLLAAHAVTNILEALQKADPRNAEAYTRNAAAYVERLHKLHEHINTTLAPHWGRTLVTYHDAFPYFARRYGLQLAGVVQEVADVDPTARHLTELRAIVREQKVSVLFMEAGSDARRVKQLAADLGVKIATLDPLESGALSPAAYEGGMRRNAESIRKAFDAPVP